MELGPVSEVLHSVPERLRVETLHVRVPHGMYMYPSEQSPAVQTVVDLECLVIAPHALCSFSGGGERAESPARPILSPLRAPRKCPG